ncbi:MAG: hypothetical protein FWG82_00995 [Oscillospiraceae bacterium]|nr:hypothetical protein [Oscillospiraceae bacterium]
MSVFDGLIQVADDVVVDALIVGAEESAGGGGFLDGLIPGPDDVDTEFFGQHFFQLFSSWLAAVFSNNFSDKLAETWTAIWQRIVDWFNWDWLTSRDPDALPPID